ncbi:MAG TPA: DUF6259 domain-containing protein [Chthoniobacteraceae bacterium]|jgi:hypothetical protein|nr:DUF6259 domain-containing protein [Chthoniobacteraceae bacterium]
MLPRCWCLVLSFVSGGLVATAPPAPAADAGRLFPAGEEKVRVVERADAIGLANGQIAFLLRRDDGALLEMWQKGGPGLIRETLPTPLWTFELAPVGSSKPQVVAAGHQDKLSFATKMEEAGGTLEMTAEGEGRKVIVRAGLAAHATLVRWRIEVILGQGARLWSVTFPQVPVATVDPEPAENQMVVPYRRGQLRTYGKGFPRADGDLPYPGPSAKFQFLAAYGRTATRGLYLAAEDGAGFTKSFATRNYPQADAVVFAVQHFPANRGAGVDRFALPYDVVTGPFSGDWWDAARLYREWWVKQEWASRGLLAERRDLPEWLLRAPFATRPSTTKPERTVANNLTALRSLSRSFDGRPFIGTWYGCTEKPGGSTNLDEGGHGHLLPPKSGLVDAVKEARDQGIHLLAYVQSAIYDESVPEPDAAAAHRALTRDAKGAAVAYGGVAGSQLGMMCRATDWSQTRMAELSRRAVAEWGFDGVYLDSFGKGAPECFAPDHGHAVGGGNTLIAGQRVMARRVLAAMRTSNPEAFLSGEDPVEAFRDLVDLNLYAVNVTANYVPITRTIWGDYSLGHGRVLGPGEAFIPECAALFLEGTIPGRIYCESPNLYLLQPEFAREFAFLKTLTAYTDQGHAWLRAGEYLRPLSLTPPPPVFEFKESVEKQLVRFPGVLHSVTRSHADGSVAIVLVNLTAQAQTVAVPINPSSRGAALLEHEATLQRMDQQATRTDLAAGREPWQQSVTLQPLEVCFLILR